MTSASLLEPRLRERFHELRFRRANPVTVALSYTLNVADSILFIFRLARLVREHRADAIYGNHMMVKIVAAVAGVFSKRPVLLHCRTIYSSALERWLYVSFASLPSVRRIVAVSDASASNFRAISEKVRVVRNGVPLEELAESAEGPDPRAELGIGPDRCVIGFVGRLVHWKGVDVVLDAAAQLNRERDDLTFVLVGDVPVGSTHASLEDYRAAAKERGLDGRVFFTGFVASPARWVRSFDALLVPSVSPDPCPRVVIEAMALGTPVIGTDHGGIPEVIEHETSGLLVPPGDVGALSAAVGRLADDAVLRRDISEEAVRKVRRDHGAREVAERIQAQIVEVVGARRAS